ncbi:MAG TPA: hypothetical protein ENK48_06420 [Gammaproteobacteria bacterium]|nr:hypothetical protein [Gammaproteobacteria bacterium]
MWNSRLSKGALLAVLALALAACSSSRINHRHPLLQKSAQAAPPPARVYFIRPRTERYMGPADNRLRVEADRFPLMKLAKGEYTLIPMVPGEVWITVTNLTAWGPRNLMKEMTRSTRFRFRSGETYYLVFEPVDGEFRGVYFRVRPVDAFEARELVPYARPVGLARRAPLPGALR